MKPGVVFREDAVVFVQAEVAGKIVVLLVHLSRHFESKLKVFRLLAAVVFYQQRKAEYLQHKEEQEYKKPSDEQENVTQGMW